MPDTPVVSILIPNFDNGRQSSRDGTRDFLGDLFASLLATLRDDPTPLEIIVADDGSTDDSLATARAWAGRAWPDGSPRAGTPFCRLIELDHCGVLSVVANRLTREARGTFCCRLDGDIVIRTPRWAARLVETFEAGPPGLGVIGPKQLSVSGFIHSAGSWILHPRGHHHVAQGAPSDTVTRAIEVDHVMGCFYCHRRTLWEELGGYDESLLRGQTVDFGLRARLAGHRAFAVPDIEFVHAHSERARRATTADAPEGIERTLDAFTTKWGFDRLAPDLDAVAARYAGTPLLWNARVFGSALPWPPPQETPPEIGATEWGRYAGDTAYRAAIDGRVGVVNALREQCAGVRRVLHVRSRAGLLSHLLARRGIETVGVDPAPGFVRVARDACAGHDGPEPAFLVQDDPRRLPLPDGDVDAVLLFDVLETHPNPVGLLREARRVLRPGGAIALVVRERMRPFDGDHDRNHPYRPHELVLQLQGSRCFRPLPAEAAPDLPGVLTLFGTRRDEAQPTFYSGAGAAATPALEGATA